MDLEESLKFYTEALGFKEFRRKDLPEYEFTLVFLGDESGTFEIELTYNYKPEKSSVLINGYNHLAVGVSDLEGSRDHHQKLD